MADAKMGRSIKKLTIRFEGLRCWPWTARASAPLQWPSTICSRRSKGEPATATARRQNSNSLPPA